jgi:hypothetical protein
MYGTRRNKSRRKERKRKTKAQQTDNQITNALYQHGTNQEDSPTAAATAARLSQTASMIQGQHQTLSNTQKPS